MANAEYERLTAGIFSDSVPPLIYSVTITTVGKDPSFSVEINGASFIKDSRARYACLLALLLKAGINVFVNTEAAKKCNNRKKMLDGTPFTEVDFRADLVRPNVRIVLDKILSEHFIPLEVDVRRSGNRIVAVAIAASVK